MMFEVGSIGGTKLDAAAALRQTHVAPHARHHYSVKNQMMRLLRRSKSSATQPAEKISPKHVAHHNGYHYHHNHVVHPQTRVMNAVEGLPFVVGKTKKVRYSVYAD
ncbi:hypothetical protein JTB14_015799 [Gonioctena quinquepunctata]|nr:hypothetical protein JTB14_015799 [Gonioctena quinquepunctata]